jgi:hypothetical protein
MTEISCTYRTHLISLDLKNCEPESTLTPDPSPNIRRGECDSFTRVARSFYPFATSNKYWTRFFVRFDINWKNFSHTKKHQISLLPQAGEAIPPEGASWNQEGLGMRVASTIAALLSLKIKNRFLKVAP